MNNRYGKYIIFDEREMTGREVRHSMTEEDAFGMCAMLFGYDDSPQVYRDLYKKEFGTISCMDYKEIQDGNMQEREWFIRRCLSIYDVYNLEIRYMETPPEFKILFKNTMNMQWEPEALVMSRNSAH